MNRADVVLRESGPRGLALAHSVLGPAAAPPVLVLHGITASRRYWLPRILPLASSYRLYLPDLAGFGLSPKPVTDYTMPFFVETTMGLLERHGLCDRPLRVVAHSLGALVGLELASRPDCRVERLALLNVPRFRDDDEAHRTMLRGSASYRRLLTMSSLSASWSQVRRAGLRLSARNVRRIPWSVLADARKFSFRSLSSTIEHCLLRYRGDDVIARLSPDIRLLLLHGDNDQVAPLPAVEEVCRLHPRARLSVLRGAGHNPFHTHTSTCLAELAAFLAAD
jgi:pimeloyl-ACP methyl ester carboxylesterase